MKVLSFLIKVKRNLMTKFGTIFVLALFFVSVIFCIFFMIFIFA